MRGGGRGRRGGGDGAWAWREASAGAAGGGRGRGRGRGRGGGGSFGHDDRDRLSHVKNAGRLKEKHVQIKGRGRGPFKGKGKGKGRPETRDAGPVGPIVDQVPEESIGRHCEVRKAHGSGITCMAMTEQGIFTGSQDKSLKRWKPEKGADNRFTLKPELTIPLADSCWSLLSSGGWLFCGLWSGLIQGFSQEGIETNLRGHSRKVTSIILHQNVLMSGSSDREVRLWQMDPNTKQFNCTHTLTEDMPGPINKLAVMGNSLFVGGMNGISVVNLESLSVTKMLPPTKAVTDFLAFQGHVIVAYQDGSIRIFDPEGTCKQETKPLAAGPLTSLAGLESGPRLLCGHSRGQVSTIVLPDFAFRTHFQALDGYKVESMLCAGHDGIFLLGSQDGSLQLWQRVGA